MLFDIKHCLCMSVCLCRCVCEFLERRVLSCTHGHSEQLWQGTVHTHTQGERDRQRKRKSYRQTAGQTTRLTDEYNNCRSNGEVLISCSARLFQTHLLDLAHSCRVVNIGVNMHQVAPPVRTSDCSLLLIYQPRKDKRLSWPSWLACSGRFTHTTGHSSDAGRAQDSESLPAKDRRSATVPCHQLLCSKCIRQSCSKRLLTYLLIYLL